MGRKIFVSYKYSDSQVQDLDIYELVDLYGTKFRHKITTTARHYVDKLAERLESDDHIYKGEDDGEIKTIEPPGRKAIIQFPDTIVFMAQVQFRFLADWL